MDIEIGQEWSFKTDRFTENSVIIHQIRPFGEDLTSVYVTINSAVRMSEDNFMNFGHFPFEIASFKSSLNELLGHSSDGHDTFKEGYKYWKSDKRTLMLEKKPSDWTMQSARHLGLALGW